ncbi:RdgB/HAM1 family non-canonical purine NTP pyrophosphatase [Galactobacter sp.]|uniref:RdgB/HAM1 family non-canonical purine NTP pyrophosphatase n=1 Tax=Galactobacter sp. TaxID=2676125 RepID=UPI0025C1DAD1|nr:RdgB/HAM1 family non-canonical purine NTP pyrophosphatase [Galactobacter sp.]
MSDPVLVLATHNQGKVRELRDLLRGAVTGLDVDTQVVSAAEVSAPDVRETGVTFEENALLKARAVAAATGLVAVADDSGLAVDVLGGAPGFLSARWCGRHGDDRANLDLLLAQLADVEAPEHRGAAFVCAAALAVPGELPSGGEELVRFGRLAGTLAFEPRGVNGFGYDPILVPAGESRSCAELEPEEKNAISHRGQAMRALLPELTRVLAGRL